MTPPFFTDAEAAELPRLDDAIVSDEDSLGAAVDHFIHQNHVAREQLREIVDRQASLRVMVEPAVWQYALQLDELVVARWADLSVELVRWAYGEGRKSVGSKP